MEQPSQPTPPRALAGLGDRFTGRILDALPSGVAVVERDGTILSINRRALERYRLAAAEVLGRFIWDVGPMSSSPAIQATLRSALARAADGESVRFEAEVPTPAGAMAKGVVWINPIVDDAGAVSHLIVTGEDKTEQLDAESARRESEERFHYTFVKAPIPMVISRMPDGTLVDVNDSFEAVLGYSRAEVIGKTSLELGFYSGEVREQLMAEFRARGMFRDREVPVRVKSGDDRIMLVNADPVEIAGRPHVLSTMVDITERRRTEQQLQESERRLRAILDHEPECVKLLGAGCTLLEMNPAGLEMMEAETFEQVRGKSVLANIRPEHRAAFADLNMRVLRGETATLEFEMQGLRGTRRWMEMHAAPMSDESGRIVALSVTRDITERKQASERLRQTTELLAAVAEGTTDALFVKDLEGRYLLCNPAAARFMKRSPDEILGRTDAEFFAADSLRVITEHDRMVLETGQTSAQEEVLTREGESRTYLSTKTPYRDSAGRIIGLIGIASDITARKQLENQFLQAQKMEAVGRLAGGVAHDFNNLLTIISGYSELLMELLPDTDPKRLSVTAISEAAGRAASLTRQLLAFSRQSVLEPKILDLAAIVGDTCRLLRRLIGEDVQLTAVTDPHLRRVKIDPGQLEQVLMNLVVNARDALTKGGKITIETRNVELKESHVTAHGDCAPGQYVLLAVSDNGCGMTPEIKARLFEPFFTTKGVGKGTGLGLAMVFGFVRQSGGCLDVISAPGQGSTFKVFLPAVTEPLSPLDAPDGRAVADGTETILLVEDEDGVRTLAQHVLQSRGYVVLAASDGKDALRLVEKHRSQIDLLLTDVVMPEMDGRDLAETLLPRYPGLKVLFSSGYTDDAVVRSGVMHDEVFFLQKPYTPHSLAKKVRDVLDATV